MGSRARQTCHGVAQACLAFVLALLMTLAFSVPSAWAANSLQQTAEEGAEGQQPYANAIDDTGEDATDDTSRNLADALFFIALYPDAEEYPASLSALEVLIRSRYTSAIRVDNALDTTDMPTTSSDVKIDSVADKGASIKPFLVHTPSEADIVKACAEQGLDYSSEKYNKKN